VDLSQLDKVPRVMKALMKTQKGKGYLSLQQVSVPRIGENDVLIKIFAAGVCGTDLHIYRDEFPYWPPVILGHEFSGTIVAVGERVVDWKVGDRVVGEPHTLACGKCYLCRTGNPQLCSSKRSPGWGIDGAFAEYMRWPETKLLHRVPESLDMSAAAIVEPLANVITHIALVNVVTVGDVVVVAGTGPIAIMAAMVAKLSGANQVIVFGRNPRKLDVCRTFSAIDGVVNVTEGDPIKVVYDLTHGRGADIFIEASGSASALLTGAQVVRKLGTLIGIGLPGNETVEFPYRLLMMKSVKFLFSLSTKYEAWDRSIRILDKGIIPYEKIITTRLKLDEWETVFERNSDQNLLKAIFVM